ncbi:hypothetical protein H7S74_30295 [Priestia aryabhattai]|uniref:hypothetical protein n=1 Tax=Priestia aryabhattai TaxID=412384 RepID=UPI001ED26117|nr:hypothetical protein [Priestia aryabhattai]MBY0094926.1 hypothetical protein [Priestia aryabhattai]MBY0105586.1 hypothetical protein [Priestia aryabhattai]
MSFFPEELFQRMLNGELDDDELMALNQPDMPDYKLTDEQREEYIQYLMSCYGQTRNEAKYYIDGIK